MTVDEPEHLGARRDRRTVEWINSFLEDEDRGRGNRLPIGVAVVAPARPVDTRDAANVGMIDGREGRDIDHLEGRSRLVVTDFPRHA